MIWRLRQFRVKIICIPYLNFLPKVQLQQKHDYNSGSMQTIRNSCNPTAKFIKSVYFSATKDQSLNSYKMLI